METRLYRCEFCGTENEIAQSTSTWQLIDDPEIPIASEKVVDARPPLEDVERRERMEASLETLRKASLGIGTAALATGGVAVSSASSGSPRHASVLHMIALLLAGITMLVALLNTVPLRQTPHPTQKFAQLQQTLSWRHRLVVAGAASLAVTIAVTVAAVLK